MAEIEVTVTRKVRMDPEVAQKLAEGFLEFLDEHYAGDFGQIGSAPGPSYEELAWKYVNQIITDDENDRTTVIGIRAIHS
jgi:hypothetical protein